MYPTSGSTVLVCLCVSPVHRTRPHLQQTNHSFNNRTTASTTRPQLQQPNPSFNNQTTALTTRPQLRQQDHSFNNHTTATTTGPELRQPDHSFNNQTARCTLLPATYSHCPSDDVGLSSRWCCAELATCRRCLAAIDNWATSCHYAMKPSGAGVPIMAGVQR